MDENWVLLKVRMKLKLLGMCGMAEAFFKYGNHNDEVKDKIRQLLIWHLCTILQI
jgi:hypothetical protein